MSETRRHSWKHRESRLRKRVTSHAPALEEEVKGENRSSG